MTKISVTIITLNEEHNIEACIRSVLDIVDEIIVLDSGSTDSTCSIARTLGARVFSQPYLGDGFQKNEAARHATNDWVLSLDADERLSAALRQFLQVEPLQAGHAYSFRRKNHVSSRWIRFGDAYPDRLVRLYQKSRYRYRELIEHSSIDCPDVIKCNLDIDHFATESIAQMYEKSIKFAKRSAKRMYVEKVSPKNPILSGLWQFIRLYFFKFGFLGGSDSFHHCLSAGLRSFYKYSFLREYRSDQAVASKINLKSHW